MELFQNVNKHLGKLLEAVPLLQRAAPTSQGWSTGMVPLLQQSSGVFLGMYITQGVMTVSNLLTR